MNSLLFWLVVICCLSMLLGAFLSYDAIQRIKSGMTHLSDTTAGEDFGYISGVFGGVGLLIGFYCLLLVLFPDV